MSIFNGLSFDKLFKNTPKPLVNDFAEEVIDDGAVIIQGGTNFSYLYDPGTLQNTEDEIELIKTYRAIGRSVEGDSAIQEIISDMIVTDDVRDVVELNLDNTDLSDNIQKKLRDEWDIVYNLLDFNNKGYKLAKSWYIDGRQFFHKLVDPDNPSKGILQLKWLNSLKIRKYREITKEQNDKGVDVIKEINEFFLYDNDTQIGFETKLRIPSELIAYVPSGKTRNNIVISEIDKAIKPFNQLNDLETSVVISRVARAPERRVFYVDVGKLPKTQAENYLTHIISKYKNKIVYDTQKGQVKDSRHVTSMLEDIWLPRRDGCLKLSTKVNVYNDSHNKSKTLQQLIYDYDNGIENWTYSVSPEGKIVPGLISWAGITRENTEVLKVHLDNGESITATPDHKFILRDGTKIEAKDLKPNDSLMPYYEKDNKIFDNQKMEWVTKSDIEKEHTKNYKFIVYKTTNIVNGKFYIGKHKQNQVTFDGYFGTGSVITKAIKKYGRHNFKREVLFATNNENLAFEKEFEFLKDCYLNEDCYNLSSGGIGGASGVVRTDEYKANMSESCKKHTKTEEHKANLSNAGKDFYQTEEGQKRKLEITKQNIERDSFQWARQSIKENRNLDKASMPHNEYLKKWSPGLPKMLINNEKIKNNWKKYSFITISDIINDNFKYDITTKDIINKIKFVYPKFTRATFYKVLNQNGYKNPSDYLSVIYGDKYKWNNNQIEFTFYNHKVSKIELLEEKMDVGTLTIDQDEIYNDYHNFSLTCGIFVMNSKGTEVQNFQSSGQNLDSIEDILYFRRKYYKALNIPISRLEQETTFNISRTGEITRDEIKFSKFIDNLQNQYNTLFLDLLKTQCILKKVTTEEEWEKLSSLIKFDYNEDDYFKEMTDIEMLRSRIELADSMEMYVGKYYSHEHMRKNIFKQTDDELKDEDKKIKEEEKNSQYQELEDDFDEIPPEETDKKEDE